MFLPKKVVSLSWLFLIGLFLVKTMDKSELTPVLGKSQWGSIAYWLLGDNGLNRHASRCRYNKYSIYLSFRTFTLAFSTNIFLVLLQNTHPLAFSYQYSYAVVHYYKSLSFLQSASVRPLHL